MSETYEQFEKRMYQGQVSFEQLQRWYYDEVVNKPKSYTLADLEQARKQGAEDERGRCIEVGKNAALSTPYENPTRKYVASLVEAAIRALGPIGETREEGRT